MLKNIRKVIVDVVVPGVGRNDGSVGGEVRGHLPPLPGLQGRVQFPVQVIFAPEIKRRSNSNP